MIDELGGLIGLRAKAVARCWRGTLHDLPALQGLSALYDIHIQCTGLV
jgi:hypothetical protein